MIDIIKQNSQRNLLVVMAFIVIGFASSCGKEEIGGDVTADTEASKILEAIGGTWAVSPSGIPSGAQALINDPSVTIVTATSGATWTSDEVSGLSNFVTGGEFTLNDDGSVATINIFPANGSGLIVSNEEATVTSSTVVISFGLAEGSAGSRIAAIGTWTLTINITNQE